MPTEEQMTEPSHGRLHLTQVSFPRQALAPERSRRRGAIPLIFSILIAFNEQQDRRELEWIQSLMRKI
jgi:hypothetical protein